MLKQALDEFEQKVSTQKNENKRFMKEHYDNIQKEMIDTQREQSERKAQLL